MADVKFSQFASGGDMQVGDTVVGLRANTNTIYTFPGNGIKDSFGNYLFQYETAAPTFTSVDFLVLTNSLAGGSPSLTVAGADLNIPLSLEGKGTGPVTISQQKWPLTDIGFTNRVLTTDGAGNLFWGVDAGAGTVDFGNANEIAFYASSGTTVDGLPTANNGVLVTDGSGVPSISSSLPVNVTNNITTVGTIVSGVWNGTLIDVAHGGTGNSTFVPYAVLAGGVSATDPLQQVSPVGVSNQILTSNGPGNLPTWEDNTAAGFTWNNVTVAGPTPLVDKNGYIANAAAQTLFTLPVAPVIGDFFSVAGSAASGWQVQANAGQVMNLGNTASTAGGTMTSTQQFDQVDILCVGVAPGVFVVHAGVGNPDLL